MKERTRPTVENAVISARPNRIPLKDQARDVLTLYGNKDPNREYRMVMDLKNGRIAQMKLAGWRIETDKSMQVGEVTTSTATGEGSPIKTHSKGFDRETGEPVYMYLMSIEKELYEYDKKVKQDEIDEQERGMVQNKLGADYGSIKLSRD